MRKMWSWVCWRWSRVARPVVVAPQAPSTRQGAADKGRRLARRVRGDSLKAAQDAQAALEAELKVQTDKFALFRSYSKATELPPRPRPQPRSRAGRVAARRSEERSDGPDRGGQDGPHRGAEMLRRREGKGTRLISSDEGGSAAKTSIADAARRWRGAVPRSQAKAEGRRMPRDVSTAVQTAIDAKKASKVGDVRTGRARSPAAVSFRRNPFRATASSDELQSKRLRRRRGRVWIGLFLAAPPWHRATACAWFGARVRKLGCVRDRPPRPCVPRRATP